MPYRIAFDAQNRILRGQFDGRVTDDELKEFYRIAPDYIARFDPRVGITDFSAVTSFDVSPQAIRELANTPPAVPDPKRPRFIVAPSPQIFGMARMFELQGEKTRPSLQVVRTLEDVWDFLGVQEPHFEPVLMEG